MGVGRSPREALSVHFEPLALEGAFHVTVAPIRDDRGFFARAWCADELAAHGAVGRIAQMNVSTNVRAGTIRGFHYQTGQDAEDKFFRCIAGRTWHVVVDLRERSATLGQWISVDLAAERFDALVVPAGCAHAYQAQTDGAAVLYATSTSYAPGAERGFRFDDPALAITWPIAGAIVSEKDRAWPDLDLPARAATRGATS
jgi:dTDP-4-dehydrorhamnose 3,5-epimerase